jgi:hypothetical protein
VRMHNHQMMSGLMSSKRRHPRVEVRGFVGDIADGNFVLEGIVEDVSSGGFKMSSLPGNFSAADRNYTAVISGKGKHYKVIVIPCWTKKIYNSRTVDAGFKIVQAPWEWTEFVLGSESLFGLGDDVSFSS